MKTLYFLIAFISLSIMFSCTEEEIVKHIEAKYIEFDCSILSVDGDDEYDDPDSLLTIEQLRTKYKYFEIYDKYVEITEDGMMVLRMSEEQWLSTGLPKSYYDNVIRSFNEVNRNTLKITDSIYRSGRIEASHEGLANYRQAWRKRYAKVKHLLD